MYYFQPCFDWLASNSQYYRVHYTKSIFKGICDNFEIYMTHVLECYENVIYEMYSGTWNCSQKYDFLAVRFVKNELAHS